MTDNMIGKLVRWECRGQWFVARVTGGDGGSGRGSLTGEVVDPGTYVTGYAERGGLNVGEVLPNLRPELITVVADA